MKRRSFLQLLGVLTTASLTTGLHEVQAGLFRSPVTTNHLRPPGAVPEADFIGKCIRCGRCVDACPMGLVPSMLSILGQRGLFEVAKDQYDLLDCVECGSCVYTCPAKRNIVHYVKYLKSLNAAAAAKK